MTMKKKENILPINGVDYYVATYYNGLSDDGDTNTTTVLLLHGMPDTGAMWDKLVKALVLEQGKTKNYRVIVPDMLGYGRTSKPADSKRYCGEKVVADLIQLIQQLKLPKCHIVGHDWGAYVSWELVTHLPDQFLRHVAISMSHPCVFSTHLNMKSIRDNWYMYLNTQEASVDLYMLDNCSFYKEFIIPTHPEKDEVCSRLSNKEAMRSMLNWDKGNPLAELYALTLSGELKYPKVLVPTLGLWSAGDTYLLEEHMQQSADYVDAEWQYVRLSSGSHWCMLDNPTETSNAIIDWFEKK